MDEANEVETREIEHVSTKMNEYPRDLLKRFATGNYHHQNQLPEKTVDTEEIELNLGLSLGGRFGVDPKQSKLVRSSSIAVLKTLLKEDDSAAPPPVVYHALIKTTSLPTQTEEEWRKRKELQSLRRMEAKRKRSEKQMNFRASKDRTVLEGNGEEDKRGAEAAAEEEEEEGLVLMNSKGKVENGLSSSMAVDFGVPAWAASAGRGGLIRGIDASPAAAVRGFPPQMSQGSVGSQGSSFSGISDFEGRQIQGSSNCTEARSPVSVQSLPEQQSEQKPIIAPRITSIEKSGMSSKAEVENQSKKKKHKVIDEEEVRETGLNVMEEMPCVSTKGDGPNGRRIEGLLYKYKEGEEVRIVCVCHGSFLTPAEFVKHAGGGDVQHPLRHIVVNPSPSFL